MSKLFRLLLVALLSLTTASFTTSCGAGTPGPCEADRVQVAGVELTDRAGRWLDALKLAGSSSRIALATPVQTMQDIKRDTEKTSVPPCLETAKGYLVDSMDKTINAFLAFMGQEHDTVVQTRLQQGTELMKQYTSELARVKACAPNCAHGAAP